MFVIFISIRKVEGKKIYRSKCQVYGIKTENVAIYINRYITSLEDFLFLHIRILTVTYKYYLYRHNLLSFPNTISISYLRRYNLFHYDNVKHKKKKTKTYFLVLFLIYRSRYDFTFVELIEIPNEPMSLLYPMEFPNNEILIIISQVCYCYNK